VQEIQRPSKCIFYIHCTRSVPQFLSSRIDYLQASYQKEYRFRILGHTERLHNLYSPSYIIAVTISGRMRWKSHKTLSGKTERTTSEAREGNIKMYDYSFSVSLDFNGLHDIISQTIEHFSIEPDLQKLDWEQVLIKDCAVRYSFEMI
jgi:hypothetical protein